MFLHLSVILFTRWGECLPHCMLGYTPPSRHPRADSSPRQTSPGRHPPANTPPGRHPLPANTPPSKHPSRQRPPGRQPPSDTTGNILVLLQRNAYSHLHQLLEYEVEMDMMKNTKEYLTDRLVACRQTAYKLETLPNNTPSKVSHKHTHTHTHQGIPHTQTSGLQTDNIQTGNTT